jgi:hypothetical protein
MLQVNEPSEEQTQKDQSRQAELHKSVTDTLKGNKIQEDILKDLGLSPKADEPGPAKEIKKYVEEEQEQEEESKEEDAEEEVQEEEQEEKSKDEEDEEVIPKSKVQKRFDELTAQKKALEKELEELKASKSEPKDEISKQLEGMTQEQLKAAKLEVRKAQIKAQNDDAKLNELLALEEKIDSAISDAPKNFQKAQAAAYTKMANKIAESGEVKDLDKVAPTIIKLANEIYAEYPLLQKDVNGQATALELAFKHYKAINSAPGDKTKETELKRQNNNLKRKVTLDTKSGKANIEKSKLDTLKKSAINGTMRQKVELVKTHPMFNVDAMIPDEFKGR